MTAQIAKVTYFCGNIHYLHSSSPQRMTACGTYTLIIFLSSFLFFIPQPYHHGLFLSLPTVLPPIQQHRRHDADGSIIVLFIINYSEKGKEC